MSAAREGLRALELQYGEVGRIATTAGEEMDELVAVLSRCEWWLSTHPGGEAMRDVCRAVLTKVRGFT